MNCKFCNMPAQGGFCSYCGAPLPKEEPAAKNATQETTIWEGRSSGITDKALSKANMTGDTYTITTHRIIITQGLLSKAQTQINLHKIRNIAVKTSLLDKNIGTITIISDPATTTELKNIENPFAVKEIMQDAINKRRDELDIYLHESNDSPVSNTTVVINQGAAYPQKGLKCPKCGTVNSQIIDVKAKKPISAGKVTAGILTGGVSLLATGIKSNKRIEHYCNNCGHKWKTK